MAQLLAGGIIAFGLLVIALAIFIAFLEQKKSVSSISTQQPEPQKLEQDGTSSFLEQASISVPQHSQTEKKEVAENALSTVKPDTSALHIYAGAQSTAWWHEQLSSLTAQLRYLREHAKDVERQIAILSEIATLATELEMLQRKRDILPESKISLFPLQVHRQPTDMSYVTDKRPAVRKYKIEAMS